MIPGDRELLYLAIENVVRNGIRYTALGTHVTVRVAQKMIEGVGFATVSITDQGPGIPEADLPHISVLFIVLTGLAAPQPVVMASVWQLQNARCSCMAELCEPSIEKTKERS